jgi:hypothetical protein
LKILHLFIQIVWKLDAEWCTMIVY